MERLLTIREIAGRLGVPESNLRYYRDHIGEFIPSKGRGRKRRYTEEAVGVFQSVLEMVRDGMTLDRIYVRLAGEEQGAVAQPQPQPQQAQPPDFDVIVEKLALKMNELSSSVEAERKNATLEERVRSLSEEVKSLKTKIAGFIEEAETKNRTTLELRVERDHLAKKLRESDVEKSGMLEAIQKLKDEIAEKEKTIERQRMSLVGEREHIAALAQEMRSIKTLLENLVFKAQGVNAGTAGAREKMPN